MCASRDCWQASSWCGTAKRASRMLGTLRRDARVCQFARREGILLRPLGNVIVIVPPLAISIDELDRMLLVIERGIAEVTRATAV